MAKKLIVGNWKMNPWELKTAKRTFVDIKKVASRLRSVQTVVCAPHVFLGDLRPAVTGRTCVLGAQNSHAETEGAYTGEVSPMMLTSMGIKYVILGHSERRAMGETDEVIAVKVASAVKSGLIVILCVGESKRDRDGKYLAFIKDQLKKSLQKVPADQLSKVVVAYEPIWAIGKASTRPAEPADVVEMRLFIRKTLADMYTKEKGEKTLVLYGGSANGKNAGAFLTEGEADGLLVGRASLDAQEFGKILLSAEVA